MCRTLFRDHVLSISTGFQIILCYLFLEIYQSLTVGWLYTDSVQINELKFVEKVRKVNCEQGGIDEVVDNQIGVMPETYLWGVGGFPAIVPEYARIEVKPSFH